MTTATPAGAGAASPPGWLRRRSGARRSGARRPGRIAAGEPAPEGGAGGGGARAKAIESTVREYIGALDTRNGRAVCELFVPGAIQELKLPKQKGSCAASLRASIGYRDPRGLPVWEHARVTRVASKVRRNDARAVATVVTEFADRNEPSVEDDVIYLARSGRLWKIAKPSSTIYRAVGSRGPALGADASVGLAANSTVRLFCVSRP